MTVPTPTSTEARLADLEARLTHTETRLSHTETRLRAVEDQLALLRIVAAYGPAVDSGSADVTAAMWADDGVYDTFPTLLAGRDAVRTMVERDAHQHLIRAGAAHLIGVPHIQIDGDTAIVTNYSPLIRRMPEGEGYRVWRTGANRWEFVRTPEGWQVARRTNRPLDGSTEGRDLLARGVASPQDDPPPPHSPGRD